MSFIVGKPFPELKLPAVRVQNGERQTQIVDVEQLRGKSFVLFVYPKDQTCGCTLEAREFGELYPQFKDLNVEIFGLSRDSAGSHSKFIEANELPFALFCDANRVWLEQNGLTFAAKLYGKPVTKTARTTILVDETGIVQNVWEKVVPENHAREVLKWIQNWRGERLETGAVEEGS